MALTEDFWRQVDRRIRAVLDEWAVQKLGGLIRGGKVSGGAIGGTIPLGSVPVHAATHENTGADELSVTGLSGVLADPQMPVAHAIDGADHTAAGLTPGDVLTALTATTIGFDTPTGGGAIMDHDHSGDVGDGGPFDAANLTSATATDGHVLTADGTGGVVWETLPAAGLTNPMTEIGDMIFGTGNYSPGSNVALLALGTSAIASSVYQTGFANNAIDGDDGTYWGGGDNPAADDWLRVDLGTAKRIGRIRLHQANPASQNQWASTYRVEHSDDSTTWTTAIVVTHAVAVIDETIDLPTLFLARYWRVYCTVGGIYSWIIYSLELIEFTSSEGVIPTRLSIGMADQVLKVNADATAPEWGPGVPAGTQVTYDGHIGATGLKTTYSGGIS